MITSLTRPERNPLDLADLAPDKDGSSPERISNKLLVLILNAGGDEVLEHFRTLMDAPGNEELKALFKKLQIEQSPQVVAHWVHGISLAGWNLDTADQVLELAKTKGNEEIESYKRQQKFVAETHFNGTGFFNPLSDEEVQALENLNKLSTRRS
jgi:hypothetical protein